MAVSRIGLSEQGWVEEGTVVVLNFAVRRKRLQYVTGFLMNYWVRLIGEIASAIQPSVLLVVFLLPLFAVVSF